MTVRVICPTGGCGRTEPGLCGECGNVAAPTPPDALREAAEELILRWDGQIGHQPVNTSIRAAVESLRAALAPSTPTRG